MATFTFEIVSASLNCQLGGEGGAGGAGGGSGSGAGVAGVCFAGV